MKPIKSFKILEYLNPTWYFNLFPINVNSFSTCYYNSSVMKIPKEFKKLAAEDSRYTSKSAKDLDIGFQLWNKGVMLKSENISLDELMHEDKPTLEDNYIFIRKFYKPNRAYYFLIKNIFSFHNPFSEVKAFIKTKDVKKVDLINSRCEYTGYENFSSALIKSEPLVSIIIPTLNRYEYLEDVLGDLEKQDYKNFEIIIVDQTDNSNKDFYKKFEIKLKLIFQKGKGQWLARNEAIRKAKGDYLLFFDDDSRVDGDWISQHLKGLNFFDADISAGVSISKTGDPVPANYSFFRWADQFDSGNALVKREVFEKVGMFDRHFDKQRMGDGEFGLRAYLAGFKSISHPYAKRLHLKIGTGGLRQMGSWDAFRPKNFFAPRPIPSVLYLYRKYFPADYVSNALMLGMLPSLIPYKWKGKRFLYPFGALLAIFILPVMLLQLSISWSRSSKMLNQGDKVEWL
ncbi:MAG: glycosyltransferase family 2 protein [Bacteroidota bacterium]|nr:glycosyltransferase family 2 protein [Bacteroidota bacterium]